MSRVMGSKGHCGSYGSWGVEMIEVYLANIIEVKAIQVTARGEERVKDTFDVIYCDTVVRREGVEGGSDNFGIHSTVTLDIDILA